MFNVTLKICMSQLSLLTPIQAEAPTQINSNNSSSVTQLLKREPLEFSALVGQSIASYLLNGAIFADRVAPAYLFAGVDGIGKTLAAKIFSTQLLDTNNINSHPDIIWVEPTYLHQGSLVNSSESAFDGIKRKYPPQIRIEQIRELTQFLSYSPLIAQSKVAVITSSHCMASAAANALLKTLEEPINGTIILISSQPQKLLPTVVSRCQVIGFHRLNCTQIVAVLEKLERQEILSNPTVMSLAAGSPGWAIAHHEQLQSIPPTLIKQLLLPPTKALTAMQVAKDVDTLEYHQQIWLLDYLQHSWWHRYFDVGLAQKVEEAKTALTKMANSRLVWEVFFLSCATQKICC